MDSGITMPSGPDNPSLESLPLHATDDNTLDGGARNQEEVCRICRGEATPQEPLFYPCKCSGSIKFVHQECLMVWLSHSRKKHCELCKTSFRFTKLYHPQMPQRLPNSVFLRKAAIHLGKALISWLRGILVVSVWALWLPWSMRFVWWGLFWIGDGSWNHNFAALKTAWDPDENSTTTALPDDLPHMLQLPVMKHLLASLGLSNSSTGLPHVGLNHTTGNSTSLASSANISSLLSDTAFFHDLTPNPGLNKFILDTVEGQIITLSVVSGFILVFLIREWVVQQQPGLNLAADIAGGVNEGLAQNPPHNEHGQQNEREPAPEVQNVAQDRDQDQDQRVREGQQEQAEQTQQENQQMQNENFDESSTNAVVEGDYTADPSMEDIDALISELQLRHESLKHLEREIRLTGVGNVTELRSANDLASRTRETYFSLRKLSKDALASGALSEAKSALDRLQRVIPAIQYMPFAENGELDEVTRTLQEYIRVAYQYLEEKRTTASVIETNVASDAQNLPATKVDTDLVVDLAEDLSRLEPLLDEAQLDGTIANVNEDTTEASGTVEDSVHPQAEIEDSEDGGSHPDFYTIHVHSPVFASRNENLETAHNGAQASNGDVEFAESLPRNEGNSSIDNGRAPTIEQRREPSVGSEPVDDLQRSHEPVNVLLDDNSVIFETNTVPPLDMPTQVDHIDQPRPGSDPVTEPEGVPPDDRSVVDRLMDWIYGDLIPPVPQPDQERLDEHVVQDMAAEAPFVPFNDARVDNGALQNFDENAGAANEPDAQAELNAEEAEAIEDAEDLEGILELIGIQGPLINLFQNAVFAAVLVSATVASAILFPYLCGKVMLLVLANPITSLNLPFRTVSALTNFAIDLCIVIGGSAIWCLDWPVELLLLQIGRVTPSWTWLTQARSLGRVALRASDAATKRIVESIANSSEMSGQLSFHLGSHRALRTLEGHLAWYIDFYGTKAVHTWRYLFALPYLPLKGLQADLVDGATYCARLLYEDWVHTWALIRRIPAFINSGGAMALSSYAFPDENATTADDWTIQDRIIAIVAGYAFFAIAGTLYINRGAPFASSEQGKRVETIIRDIFQQSAGVVKVILIITLEMLIFPLYCGYLVDAAMLPLFEDSTLHSRFAFTLSSPWTSAFFHWFVGTLFMWNFALFVSMCRKMFRKGVLYFIRDPDDPNFHPIRDVLEKSLASQLSKIAFSALVYGLLIGICMGSIVWAVSYGVAGVFPIKWTAKESYFGYPVDLLLYNFLAPLTIHFLRPSHGINKVYEWWFRKSAHFLRLSHFLFDDFREDERGQAIEEKSSFGTFVRAPGTDSVRIPRGRRVFLEVTEENVRVDGLPDGDQFDEMHGRNNEEFSKIWIPPMFQIRIGLFVVLMWAMTAMVGLSTTVAPLLLGRKAISLLTSGRAPLNDLYSYFTGMFPLVAGFYSRAAIMTAWNYMRERVKVDKSTLASAMKMVKNGSFRGLRIIYTYGALILVVPTLLALLLECYVILPLQTYAAFQHQPAAPHTVYLLQDWTLGLMYLRIVMRLMLWDNDSRASRGLRAIVARGWTDPDARIATRCFLLPLIVVSAAALCLPLGMAWTLAKALPTLAALAGVRDRYPQLGPEGMATLQVHMIRFSYPVVLALGLSVWSAWVLKRAAGHWRMHIRDEIYLIGERLHNFGDKRPGTAGRGAARA